MKTDPPEQVLRAQWEQRDVSGIGVIRFVICFLVGALFIHLLVAAFFKATRQRGESASFASETSVAQWESVPGPHLEIAPLSTPLKTLTDLQHYGWVDREKGIAQVPLDRAMEIIAEKWEHHEAGR